MLDVIAELPGVRERIVGVDQNVPLLDGTTRPYINFENAASTPVHADVLATVNRFMAWYAPVHRGTGFKSRIATQAYDDARRIVGAFVGANADEHVVIFGKNSTEALNTLAHRFPLAPGDVVLVSLAEHHSNDLPWRARAQVRHIGVDAQGRLDEADFERLLAENAGRVKMVAITGASNVTGFTPDIHRYAAKAHAAGAQITVDCAQLAPHRRIAMSVLSDPAHIDYVALSAHKMYAPFGTGALVGRRDTFAQGDPMLRGGGTVEIVTTDAVHLSDTPERDEAGSPNVVGVVALAAAIKVMDAIGMEAIARHEAELTAYALQRLATIEGVIIYGETDPASVNHRVGVIPITLKGMSHFLLAAILGAEWGIGIRNGCFCAHPYLLHLLNVSDAESHAVQDAILDGDRRAVPGMARISFGMYNTPQEVDTLVEALTAIAQGSYRGEYVQDRASGEYYAVGWQPDLSAHFTL